MKHDTSEEVKNTVFDMLVNFYNKHSAFCSECIMQNDDCVIDAPELLAEIADKLQFEEE